MSLFEKIIPLILPKNQVIKTDLVPMDEIEEIYCFSNTAIGDTLFNTPVFRSLKKHFPNKKLIVVLNPSNYTLFETNPYIDEIMIYSGKTKHFFSFLLELKKRKPKLILLLHSNDPQATSVSVLAGAKYIIKIPNDKNKFNIWHTNKIEKPTLEYTIYQKIRYLNYLGIDIKKDKFNVCMELYLKEEWNNNVEKYLHQVIIGKKLIGFQIGASNLSRMWFEDKWIELGQKLLVKYPNINIILTGSPNEKELTSIVEKGINDKRILNLAGKFNLGEAAALIGKLDLLITPDTGPLHIAAALNVPTITLYAVMNHIITNPVCNESIHLYIQKPITCEPCITRRCKYQKCMLQIESDEIITLVDKLI